MHFLIINARYIILENIERLLIDPNYKLKQMTIFK